MQHHFVMRVLVGVGAILARTGQAEAGAASPHAVKKVVAMLTDMAAKAKTDKHAEEIQFAEFSTWCSAQQETLAAQIEKGASEGERFSADLGTANSAAAALAEEVNAHESEVTKYEAEIAAQKAQRAKEHEGNVAEAQDYGESVDALDRAIAVLLKQSHDRPGAFLQLSDLQRQLPAKAQQMVSAFLGMMSEDDPSDFASRTAPMANAYEFQSSSIIDMLKKLRNEFVQKKAESEKEEMNNRHAHDMLVQDLTSAVAHAKESASTKSALMQGKKEDAALLGKQLATTTSVKEENAATLQKTKAECSEKKESFNEKQALRAEELQALEKAIAILSAEDVQSASAKHLGLAQIRSRSGVALVQLLGGSRSNSKSDIAGIRHRVSQFLATQGKLLHSKRLGLLAESLAEDPFAKVKQMIENMITRMMEEANSEAKHEGFCDKEVGTSKITRTKLTEEIDGLSASVESGKAKTIELTQEIGQLNKEIAELDAAVKEAMSMRAAEKAQNVATVNDAVDAQKAVGAAVAVLKDFYAKSLQATALVQESSRTAAAPVKMNSEEWKALANPDAAPVDKGHKEGMQVFGGETYTGQQEEAGGVLAMLEVVASDFATLEADTKASEEASAATHKEYLAEARKDKAAKSKQVEMNSADKTRVESKLREDTADMKLTQDKLLAAERYYETLAPQCDDKGMTFEERTKAREAEITSLKEALRILSGEDVA